jgi:hypothetical protein
MKAVSKFKRHSRSLSQQSLNKIIDEDKTEDQEGEKKSVDGEETLVKATQSLHV